MRRNNNAKSYKFASFPTELVITTNSSSTEIVNQTGKLQHVSFLCTFCQNLPYPLNFQLVQLPVSKKAARPVSTSALETTTAPANQATMETSVKVRLAWYSSFTLHLLLRWAIIQHRAGDCVRQCYATGIWSTANEDDAAVLDERNYPNRHGLALFIMQPSQRQALDVAK